MKNVNKSNLMKAAWQMVRSNKEANMSDALKVAWRAFKLKAKMCAGVVEFTFRKVTGELRKAKGTLKTNIITYQPVGSTRKECYYQIKYFDIEKKAFRSFNAYSLI